MTDAASVHLDGVIPRLIRSDRPEADAQAVLLRGTDGANPVDVAVNADGELIVDGLTGGTSEQADYTPGEVPASSIQANSGNWAQLLAAPSPAGRSLLIQNITQYDIQVSHTAAAGSSAGTHDYVVGRQRSVSIPLWQNGLEETRGAVIRFNGTKTTTVGRVHGTWLHA